ncbi:hypothetical protein N9L20_01845 [Flavobacteriaceae bacterium]|nr:hypothetical protein [Flavobacteriaceae bacterium]
MATQLIKDDFSIEQTQDLLQTIISKTINHYKLQDLSSWIHDNTSESNHEKINYLNELSSQLEELKTNNKGTKFQLNLNFELISLQGQAA